MALIICPECGNKISNSSNQCIHCGYVLSNSLMGKAPDNSYLNICPKCGKTYFAIKCPDCNTDMINTGLPQNKFSDFLTNFTKEERISWDMQMRELYVINSPQFDKALYDKRIQEEQEELAEYNAQIQAARERETNKPKCPTCGSANIEKISLTKKAVGGALFGLFSSNVRKTMHCKNCGYKW